MSAYLHRLRLAALFAALCSAAPAVAQRDDPLPRFEDPLCPGIVGLKVEAAEAMVGRIRMRAEELGLRTAPADGCEPNMIVGFIPDGRGYLQRLKRERSPIFESLGLREREDLLAHDGPVHVLAQIRTRSRDGMVVPRSNGLVQPPQTEMWMAHSRIYTATRQDITSVLLLIDPAAIGGMTLDQLADYSAMRAFAPALPQEQEVKEGSILTLFDAPAESRPTQLSPADGAALAALYDGLPNLPASARIAAIGRASGQQGEDE